MIVRLIERIKALFRPKCSHIWDARFKWEGEWAIYYEECVLCGKVEG